MRNIQLLLAIVIMTLMSPTVVCAKKVTPIQYNLVALEYQRKGDLVNAEKFIRKALVAYPNNQSMRVNLSQILQQQGKFDQAIYELNQALKYHPNSPIIYSALGRAYSQSNKISRAIEYYQQAMNLDNSLFHLSGELGELFFRSGDYQQAYDYLINAFRSDPNDINSLLNLARAEVQLQKYDNALSHLEFILQVYPQHEWALTTMAEAYLVQNKIKDAQVVYKRLIKTHPDRFDAYISLANITEDSVDAIPLLQSAIKVNPNVDIAYARLAKRFKDRNNYEQAINNYEQAIKYTQSQSQKYEYQFQLNEVLINNGDFDKAEANIALALSGDEDNILLIQQMGDLQLAKGQYQSAYNIYWKLLKDNPTLKNSSNFLRNYALTYQKLEQWPKAELVWKDYLKLEAKDINAWLDFIFVEQQQGKHELALQHYEIIKKIALDSSPVLHKMIIGQLAEIYLQRNDYESIDAIAIEILTIHKDSHTFSQLLEMFIQNGKKDQALAMLNRLQQNGYAAVDLELQRAHLVYLTGDAWSAATIYQRLLSEDSENYTALLGLADIYLEMGQYEQAQELYSQAVYLHQDDFHAQYNYALSLASLGKNEQAINEYQHALELDPSYSDAYYSIGALYLDANNTKAARQYWNQYLSLQPEGEYSSEIREKMPKLKKVSIN